MNNKRGIKIFDILKNYYFSNRNICSSTKMCNLDQLNQYLNKKNGEEKMLSPCLNKIRMFYQFINKN